MGCTESCHREKQKQQQEQCESTNTGEQLHKVACEVKQVPQCSVQLEDTVLEQSLIIDDHMIQPDKLIHIPIEDRPIDTEYTRKQKVIVAEEEARIQAERQAKEKRWKDELQTAAVRTEVH